MTERERILAILAAEEARAQAAYDRYKAEDTARAMADDDHRHRPQWSLLRAAALGRITQIKTLRFMLTKED